MDRQSWRVKNGWEYPGMWGAIIPRNSLVLGVGAGGRASGKHQYQHTATASWGILRLSDILTSQISYMSAVRIIIAVESCDFMTFSACVDAREKHQICFWAGQYDLKLSTIDFKKTMLHN
jgi:hypothetical protein